MEGPAHADVQRQAVGRRQHRGVDDLGVVHDVAAAAVATARRQVDVRGRRRGGEERLEGGIHGRFEGGQRADGAGDLEAGRRTNAQRLMRSIVTPTLRSATPGDLGLVLPYRYIVNLLEMLHALDEIAPGVCSRHTLLYGIEVKFYSNRLTLTKGLETEVHNLFACGDGAGITRGLIQASASGLIAALRRDHIIDGLKSGAGNALVPKYLRESKGYQ